MRQLNSEYSIERQQILFQMEGQKLTIVKQLSNVFPDIDGELCSRHSVLFGKLKSTFAKTYGGLDPQHYIIVKGVLEIVRAPEVELSMALENGMILMLCAVEQRKQLFLNCNHFGEEVIFTSEGELEQGIHPFTAQFEKVIEMARRGKEGKGGVLYLHCNIPQDNFSYRESMLISLFIGVSHLNDNLQCSLDQLIQRMVAMKIMGDKCFIERYFEFHNHEFRLALGTQEIHLNMDKKYKLILCQLDLAKLDILHEEQSKEKLNHCRTLLQGACKAQKGVATILDIYNSEQQLRFNFDDNEQVYSPTDPNLLLQMSLKEVSLLDSYGCGDITFQQLVSAMWELNSKYWKVHSQEAIDLVEDIREQLKVNSCMIINKNFALIVAEKARYSELLLFLKQKLKKGELKSKSHLKIQEKLIQDRWQSNQNISEVMFTSVPSEGISVFDPSQSIWFE